MELHRKRRAAPSDVALLVGYVCLAAAVVGAALNYWYSDGQSCPAAIGSVVLRLGLTGTVIVGVWRYCPRRPLFWYLISGYFMVTAMRAVYRATITFAGQWSENYADAMDTVLSTIARLLLVGACVLLLSQRRRGSASWAIDDSAVLATGLGCAFLTLHLVPLYERGVSQLVFWQYGIFVLVRCLGLLVPLIAIAYSEQIKSLPLAVFGVLLPISAICDFVQVMDLEYQLPAVVSVVVSLVPYVAQLAIGFVALQPSMAGLTEEGGRALPDWNLGRSLSLTAAVLLPVISLWLRPPGSRATQLVVLAALALLMLSVVWRMRRAVVKHLQLVRELDSQANHDRLTSLPNRRFLYGPYVDSLVERLQHRPVTLAVSYLDLDNLGEVNDRLEHSGGDALLAAVGGRLQSLINDSRSAVRVGGDEFVVITEMGCHGDGEVTARESQQVLSAVEGLADDGFDSHCSVGASWAPITDDPDVPVSRQLDKLIHEADLAQAMAKRSGGSRAMMYDPSLGARSRMSSAIRRLLPEAWSGGEMAMAYQPVIDLRTGDTLGAESLLRWTNSELGVIPPVDAIESAIRMGLVTELGLRILHQVLSDIRVAGVDGLTRIGVNLAAPQLRPAAVDQIIALVESSGLSGRLWLEVTEQQLVEEKRYAAGALADLRSRGVMIALDDFGTGYCGLDYVCTLPFDLVKLDKAFTLGLEDSVVRKRVTGLVVNISEAIGADALAEGIETMELAAQMADLGFRYGQGHALRRPQSDLVQALQPIDLPYAREL